MSNSSQKRTDSVIWFADLLFMKYLKASIQMQRLIYIYHMLFYCFFQIDHIFLQVNEMDNLQPHRSEFHLEFGNSFQVLSARLWSQDENVVSKSQQFAVDNFSEALVALIRFEKLTNYKQKQCLERWLLKANTTFYLGLQVSSQSVYNWAIQLFSSFILNSNYCELIHVTLSIPFTHLLTVPTGSALNVLLPSVTTELSFHLTICILKLFM